MLCLAHSKKGLTIKARKQIETIAKDSIRDKVEKAKKADQGAITYAKRKLHQTSVKEKKSPPAKLR